MNPILKIKQFASREDGSLLVFFLISVVTILGIVALSFDLGRRASVQTDMQSFADNVALAAAGELDGQEDAIARATWAANNAIAAANETLKAGVFAGQTLSIQSLVFYSALPDRDRPASFAVADLSDPTNASYKYSLPTTNTTTDDSLATFVGVRLNRVDPQWIFGKVFEGGNDIDNLDPGATPGDANATDNRRSVGAVAIAGNSAWTCEVSPLMFCLPPVSGTADPIQLQTLSAGRAVQLRSVGRDAAWNPGEFGFLDIDRLIAEDSNAAAGECASESPESRRQACLLAKGIDTCFNSRGVDIQPGQRSGQETAGFNLPFGIFEQVMNNLRGDEGYEVGPHIVGGREVNNGSCNDTGPLTDTMGFTLDNCHYTGGCTDGRFGDGTWTTGKDRYLDTNYSVRNPAFDPSLDEDPVSNPRNIVDGDWFDFPPPTTVPTGWTGGYTRYQYYLMEIERAANGGVMTGYPAHPAFDGFTADWSDAKYGTDTGTVAFDTWDDYWGTAGSGNPIIPDAHNRSENGLPQCSQVTGGGDPDRRVVVIAGIDCSNQTLTGREENVEVIQYYRTFMLSPATEISNDPSNGQMFDLWVEIIEPIGGEAGGSTVDAGVFREVVQLYK
ncbi:pilus assembly protein TadG-related protein [Silicimonas sp. MF1-12-2]|uniref:pilus assembly protein TadG-related protein n=1 Tax=Silicimonas sp. MF1-12-2 TaxID=3384793 RepID=UPI0039B4F49B